MGQVIGELSRDGSPGKSFASSLAALRGGSRRSKAVPTGRAVSMRRYSIPVLALLLSLVLGAGPAPAMRTHSARRAPALTRSGRTLRWNSLPGVGSYVVAAVGARLTTFHVVKGTRFAPAPRPGHTVSFVVRARVRDARWSRAVRMTWPAVGRTSQDQARLMVSVENTTGWGVDEIFRNAGVRYERLDVGDGSDLVLVAKALSDGIIPLVLYNPGPSGSLKDVPLAVTNAEVVSLAQRLSSLAVRYPSLTKLSAIEFGNEVYINERAGEYATQYDAAHRALAGHGLSSWKLLANATAVCGSYQAEDWIPTFVQHLSGGAHEVDGWTVHPYGSMVTDATPDCHGPHGFGWPDVRDWHQIAVDHGSHAPWYVTEVGQCISAGSACPTIVSPATQAADMTRYLNAAAKYPWLVYFNWYTSCDDGSGGYGLLAENSARVCGADGPSDRRPAFNALTQWIAAHGEG
jgi:hypothetical protein